MFCFKRNWRIPGLFAMTVALAMLALSGCVGPAAIDQHPSGGARRAESRAAIERRELTLPGEAEAIGISVDGKRMAAALTNRKLFVLDVPSGKIFRTFTLGGFSCERLKFSADGEMLICTSGTGLFNSKRWIDVWRLKDAKLVFSSRPDVGPKFPLGESLSQAWSADLSPGGRTVLISCKSGEVFSVDLPNQSATLELALSNKGHVMQIEYAMNGERVLLCTLGSQGSDAWTLHVLRTGDQSVEKTYAMEGKRLIGVTDDGKIVVSAPKGDAGQIAMLDLDSGKSLMDEILEQSAVTSAAIFCGGTRFMSSDERRLRVWDLGSRKVTLEIATTERQVVACEGAALAVSAGDRKAEGKVDLWLFAH